jgi:hypothetical protein
MSLPRAEFPYDEPVPVPVPMRLQLRKIVFSQLLTLKKLNYYIFFSFDRFLISMGFICENLVCDRDANMNSQKVYSFNIGTLVANVLLLF